MTASTIVETFDVKEDVRHRLLPGTIDCMMNQLHLECAEESLREGIVVTYADYDLLQEARETPPPAVGD